MGEVKARPVPLRHLVAEIFKTIGSGPDEAGCIAENLVLANLSGHDSHGIGLVPIYVEGVEKGAVRTNGTFEVVLDTGPIATLDAGMAFGQVIGRDAMALAIERVRRDGIAIVGIRNSHHLGRIGHWAEQCAEAGFASTHYVNTLGIKAHVAPWGGADARYSTNPYCCGIPGPDGVPFLLDMATSQVALGKVRVARNKGVEMAPGLIIDGEGRATQDPNALYDDPIGAILPFGTYKGYGLAVVSELLAGALTGGGTYHEGTVQTGVIHNNMLSIVFDPDRLGAAATWREDVAKSLGWIKAARPVPDGEGVLLAGEPERRARAARAEGIPVDETTWGEVAGVAGRLGVTPGLVAEVVA